MLPDDAFAVMPAVLAPVYFMAEVRGHRGHIHAHIVIYAHTNSGFEGAPSTKEYTIYV